MVPPGYAVAVYPTRPAAPPSVGPILAQLKDSLYPSERELAADALSRQDWRAHPEVVQGLLTAAREDPAPTVRAGCVHALAQMHINTLPVISAVQALKADADPRVRAEVEQALPALGVAPDVRPDVNIRHASGDGK
jgi:HEAT repeat protein